MFLRALLATVGLVASAVSAADDLPNAKQPSSSAQVVRCAVVGGLNEIDFWPQIADRFQRAMGHRLEIVATGPKHAIADAIKTGEADVIVVHSSDTVMNLVADGFAENPQPWAKNDYLIVGPASDSAGIRGERDAVAALAKIIASKSKLLLHASGGANELLSDLLAAGGLELDPQSTISTPSERQRQLLQRAAEEEAYTLVGRIPFYSGKLDSSGLVVMVEGDERLRRPFVVATSTSGERQKAARRLAAFLREPPMQAFIADFGVGKYDRRPLLFPVRLSSSRIERK